MVLNSSQMGADGVILSQKQEKRWLVKVRRLIYIPTIQELFVID